MSRRADGPSRLLASACLLSLIVGIGACGSAKPDTTSDAAASGGAISTGGSGSGGATTGSGGSPFDGRASGGEGSDSTDTDASSESGAGASDTGSAGADGRAGDPPNVDVAIPDAFLVPDIPVPLDLPARIVDVAEPFWPGDFAENCTPPEINGRPQTDGHHHAGDDCMTSGCHLDPELAAHHAGTDCRGIGCHANGSLDGSGAPAFYFGGTIYRADFLSVAPAVEVAVTTVEGFYSACSATNGNFWSLAPTRIAPPLTWSSASTRVRNADGQLVMTTGLAPGCNAAQCHSEGKRLASP
jgi:hypothetical protein